jgi:hypothetical protein
LYRRAQRVARPPKKPPSLLDGVGWIAQLGGFLARAGNGDPGPHVLWRGFQHLDQITEMFLLMRSNTWPATESTCLGDGQWRFLDR